MCDRTQDFVQCVQASQLKETGIIRKAPEVPKTKSAFQDASSDIAKGIQHTSKALTSLTKLVRRQGLFDDPTEEINNLVYRIKEDLRELNTKCDTAQQYIDSQKSGYNVQKQSSAHSMKVVGQLKTELMNTTKDFKGILEVRSAKIKDQQKRKVELTGTGSLSMSMTPMKQKQKDDKNNQQKSGGFNSNVPSPYNSNSELSFSGMKAPAPGSTALTVDGSPLSSSNTNSHQQLLLVAPPAAQQYYEAREQAVTEVERTIAELGTLFKRLAGMIAEQQELVERVDEDVESAVANADRAHTVLLKMYDNASSNRAMYTKLSAILAIFILIFVLFLM